jgi:hypothetical protein
MGEEILLGLLQGHALLFRQARRSATPSVRVGPGTELTVTPEPTQVSAMPRATDSWADLLMP